MMEKLYVNLQEQRKKKGLSQADVAEHLHISRQAISQWETGKTQPDISSLQALCTLYGISVSEMLGEEQSEDETLVEKKIGTNTILNIVVLTLVLALASQVAIVGIVISIVTFIWAIKRKVKARKVIYIICVITFLVATMNTYAVLSYYFLPNAGSGTIEML